MSSILVALIALSVIFAWYAIVSQGQEIHDLAARLNDVEHDALKPAPVPTPDGGTVFCRSGAEADRFRDAFRKGARIQRIPPTCGRCGDTGWQTRKIPCPCPVGEQMVDLMELSR